MIYIAETCVEVRALRTSKLIQHCKGVKRAGNPEITSAGQVVNCISHLHDTRLVPRHNKHWLYFHISNFGTETWENASGSVVDFNGSSFGCLQNCDRSCPGRNGTAGRLWE